jgi:hypothetical protein
MEIFDAIDVNAEDRWIELLEKIGVYDVYHLPSYHKLSEISDKGKAVLLSYVRNNLIVVFPILLRKIDSISIFETVGEGWHDAVSVYGYAGPLSSRVLSKKEKKYFWGHLKEYFDSARIVSVFSSIHPLLNQKDLLNGFGEIISTNPTLSIDLTLPPEVIWGRYRKRYKSQINQLKRKGYNCFEDKDKFYWNEFIDSYYESMRKINATGYYFFPRDYFAYIKDKMSDFVKLFVCFHENILVHAATITYCNGIIQYHLVGAVENDHKEIGPGKLLIDSVRHWGVERKAYNFHLGRGFGGAEDTLLHFKKGFSNKENAFYLWRLLNNNEIYDELVNELKRKTGIGSRNSYFPAYRQPDALNILERQQQ